MPKSIRPAGPRTKASHSSKPRHDGAGPIQAPSRDARPLLDRILDTPQLEHVVPRLPPEILHRVIESCGLEECGELMALATPGQLARVFDLDLWRTARPGRDEQFDADRFGVWLEVLVASGVAVAAQTVAAMDINLAVAGLAQHLFVFDPAAIAPPTTDGEEAAEASAHDDELGCTVGGYRAVARRTDSWDAIVAVLGALSDRHPERFHRVMSECRRLSNSLPEVDGLDNLLTDNEQVMFDLALDRERRREQQGYASPGQARAFLQMSRQLRLGQEAMPPGDPVARAYFRAIDWTTAAEANSGSGRLAAGPAVPPDSEASVASIVGVLLEAGVLAQPPRALLDGPHRNGTARLARIQGHMQFVRDSDDAAYSTRSQELGYLANAILAGCSIQSRPFTAQEASDAAVAVCNLGLENWPAHWLPAEARRGSSTDEGGSALPEEFLVSHDLVTVFQVGWTVLHDAVCMYVAEQLIAVLARLQSDDREVRTGLSMLRTQMRRHWKAGAPWRARDAMDVIAILDMPAWATLLGLIDECPVIHAGIGASAGSGLRAVSASAFEFISENSQIASVREFVESLPETLRG